MRLIYFVYSLILAFYVRQFHLHFSYYKSGVTLCRLSCWTICVSIINVCLTQSFFCVQNVEIHCKKRIAFCQGSPCNAHFSLPTKTHHLSTTLCEKGKLMWAQLWHSFQQKVDANVIILQNSRICVCRYKHGAALLNAKGSVSREQHMFWIVMISLIRTLFILDRM